MHQLPLVALYNSVEKSDLTTINELISKIVTALGEVPNSETLPIDCEFGLVTPVLLRTKYYKANVGLCAVKPDLTDVSELSERTGAVVIYFDGKNATPLKSTWAELEKYSEPGVKLALCPTTDENVVDEITAWCMDNEFELVETDPSDSTLEAATEYHEATSFSRCVQALSANQWSNAVFTTPQLGAPDADVAIVSTSDEQQNGDATPPSNQRQPTPDSAHQSENDPEAMDNLFQQFADMKTRADQMSDADRRKFAAEMALKFYAAIGGDSEQDDSEGER